MTFPKRDRCAVVLRGPEFKPRQPHTESKPSQRETRAPGAFEPLYFDKDHPNGSPILYVYNWDPASGTIVRDEY